MSSLTANPREHYAAQGGSSIGRRSPADGRPSRTLPTIVGVAAEGFVAASTRAKHGMSRNMSRNPSDVIRSLEAGYWRALGKKVRAENIMNGARATLVDKLRLSYFRNEQLPLPPPGSAPVVEATPLVVKTSLSSGDVAALGGQVKVKARIPIPFYGVQPQIYRSNEVIFTCVVGDRHALQSVDAELRYEHVLYVDRDVPMAGWNQRPLLFWDAAPKLITLFHKFALCSLVPNGTKMIWLDSRVNISYPVAQTLFAALEENDLCLFKHYERDCVYDEMLAVLAARRSTASQCEEYARYLRQRSFPRNGGLFETGVMAFRAGPLVSDLFRKVFGLCYRYVPRDQLTLPVALVGSEAKVHVYEGGITHLRNTPGVVVKSWKEVV